MGRDRIAELVRRAGDPELVALVIDILRNPTFPADQVEEYRRAVITGIHDAMNLADKLKAIMLEGADAAIGGGVESVQLFRQ